MRSPACLVLACSMCAATPVLAQTQAPASENTSIQGLFKTTLDDFRSLPSSTSVALLAIGGAVAAAGHTQDWDITQGFSTTRSLGNVLEPGEAIGGARMQLGAAVATYALGRVTGKRAVTSLGFDLIRSQIVAQTLTAGIKMSVRRHRPDGGEFSFPSGHTSVSFATATVVQRHFGWKAGIPSYALATYVAASRVHVKRHFFSDVAFGAAIGIVSGRAVTVGRGRARFELSPAIGMDSAGVSFKWADNR